jgi:hypothetical protein
MRWICRPAVPLLAAALAAACNTDFPNPFANRSRSLPPPTQAALVFGSDRYASRPGAGREAFALNEDGTGLTRLTYCTEVTPGCDTVELAPSSDRERVVVRRRIAGAGDESLVFVDLSRGVEAELLPATTRVSGIDWSPVEDVLVYSGAGEGGIDDLFRMDLNGQNQRPLTTTADTGERRPRVDPTGSVAVFEKIPASGKGQVWVFESSVRQLQLTGGGPGGEPLAGTTYWVGSDADPVFSPDGRLVAFRRLSAVIPQGLGSWDLLAVSSTTALPAAQVVASGPAFRGAPDWGPRGILFVETDAADGVSHLVVVQPDGSGRRVLTDAPAGFRISSPRWLR